MLHTPRALPALAACGPSGVPSGVICHLRVPSPLTRPCRCPRPRSSRCHRAAGQRRCSPGRRHRAPHPAGIGSSCGERPGAGGRGLSPSVRSTARRLLPGKAVSSHKPAGTRPPASSVPSRVPSQRCSTSARLEPHLPPHGPRATCAPGLRRRCVPRVQLSAGPTSS